VWFLVAAHNAIAVQCHCSYAPPSILSFNEVVTWCVLAFVRSADLCVFVDCFVQAKADDDNIVFTVHSTPTTSPMELHIGSDLPRSAMMTTSWI
jgi:hypothetical protein